MFLKFYVWNYIVYVILYLAYFFQYHVFNIHLFLWYVAVIHTYIPQFIINYSVDGYLSHFWFWDTLNSAVMSTLVYASIQYTGMF